MAAEMRITLGASIGLDVLLEQFLHEVGYNPVIENCHLLEP